MHGPRLWRFSKTGLRVLARVKTLDIADEPAELEALISARIGAIDRGG